MRHYGGMDRADHAELVDIVATALDEGVNLFDVTHDEERAMLGAIMTELGARTRMFLTCWISKEATGSAPKVETEAERALSLLGTDHVDVLYLDWTCNSEQALAMQRLRERGLTRFIGLLGVDTALAEDISEFDVVLVNHNFYLRDREPDIERIRRRYPHMGIISLEPLGRGRFATDATAPRDSLVVPCLKYALAFESVDATLVAVRRLSQLQENLRLWTSRGELSREERVALESGPGYAPPHPRQTARRIAIPGNRARGLPIGSCT